MSCPRNPKKRHHFGSSHRHGDGPMIVSCSWCGHTLRPCDDCQGIADGIRIRRAERNASDPADQREADIGLLG
jgi:hypothetical protein